VGLKALTKNQTKWRGEMDIEELKIHAGMLEHQLQEMRDYCQRLRRSPMVWSSMETAPRDGSWVLLAVKYSDSPALAQYRGLDRYGEEEWGVSNENYRDNVHDYNPAMIELDATPVYWAPISGMPDTMGFPD